jgi:hypothetical protein
MGNASQGVLGSNPKVDSNDWYAGVKKQLADVLEQDKKSQAEIAADIEKRRGPNTGLENYRAEEMARRANLKDEAERQKGMRLAEFFASWGSTPGSTLVAGMTALRKAIPGMVEDAKEAKKFERESDKIIFDLDQATRLEKAGYDKEAAEEKKRLADRANHLNTAIAHVYSTSITANAHLAGAAAQREANALSRTSAAEEHKWRTYNAAKDNLNHVITSIDNVKNKPGEYKEASDFIATMSGKDPSKLNPTERSMYDSKLKYVQDTDARLNKVLQNAEADVKELRARVSSAGANTPSADVELPPELPKGSKQIGTSGGKPVYEAPGGKRYVVG